MFLGCRAASTSSPFTPAASPNVPITASPAADESLSKECLLANPDSSGSLDKNANESCLIDKAVYSKDRSMRLVYSFKPREMSQVGVTRWPGSFHSTAVHPLLSPSHSSHRVERAAASCVADHHPLTMASTFSHSSSSPAPAHAIYDDETLQRLWRYIADCAAESPEGTSVSSVYSSAVRHMQDEYDVQLTVDDVRRAMTRAREKKRRRAATERQAESRSPPESRSVSSGWRSPPQRGPVVSCRSSPSSSPSRGHSLASVEHRLSPPAAQRRLRGAGRPQHTQPERSTCVGRSGRRSTMRRERRQKQRGIGRHWGTSPPQLAAPPTPVLPPLPTPTPPPHLLSPSHSHPPPPPPRSPSSLLRTPPPLLPMANPPLPPRCQTASLLVSCQLEPASPCGRRRRR